MQDFGGGSKMGLFTSSVLILFLNFLTRIYKAFYYARFFRFKNGPFSQKAKKHNLM